MVRMSKGLLPHPLQARADAGAVQTLDDGSRVKVTRKVTCVRKMVRLNKSVKLRRCPTSQPCLWFFVTIFDCD